MTRKQRRLVLIGSGLAVLGVAAALVLFALRDSIVFFNSPTDVVEKHIAPGSRIRLGGLVKPGTLARGDNLAVRFEVTDGNKSIPVTYIGILPDLFREDARVERHAVRESCRHSGEHVREQMTARERHMDARALLLELNGALEPGGTFKADSVLAKHDESYMPKEVADALKKQGHWKTETGYGLAGDTKGAVKK